MENGSQEDRSSRDTPATLSTVTVTGTEDAGRMFALGEGGICSLCTEMFESSPQQRRARAEGQAGIQRNKQRPNMEEQRGSCRAAGGSPLGFGVSPGSLCKV